MKFVAIRFPKRETAARMRLTNLWKWGKTRMEELPNTQIRVDESVFILTLTQL